MVDRDITISNLETNIRWIEDIPSHQFPGWGNVTMAMRDALELLKEQEPVTPERAYSGGGSTWWNVCGNCGTAINPNDKYCHECGRAVKWDENGSRRNGCVL